MGKNNEINFEKMVLGGMLVHRFCIPEIIGTLPSYEAFGEQKHRLIFQAIVALFQKGISIDTLTVSEELRKKDALSSVGGINYLMTLTSNIGSSEGLSYYAQCIAEKHMLRQINELADKTKANIIAAAANPYEIIGNVSSELQDILTRNAKKKGELLFDACREALKTYSDGFDVLDGITGVPSGFIELDKLTAGWQNSDLIIVAARPAMGKTALMLNLARNAAKNKAAVIVFSLEMSTGQLVNRLISSETSMPADRLKRKNLSPQETIDLGCQLDQFINLPIMLDETPSISIIELQARAKYYTLFFKKKGYDKVIIFIDYLQLITVDHINSFDSTSAVSAISGGLKALAKELNIPVVALSQLSRIVESRSDKRPQLSDLRQSGAIEQDADVVIFPYRPGYYNVKLDENGNSTDGLVELIIAKHRSGDIDSVNIYFDPTISRFSNESPPQTRQGFTRWD